MNFQLRFALQDVSGSLHRIWLFCLCLVLGVSLVMAAGSLFRVLDRAILSDMRLLLGGDIEIEANTFVQPELRKWLDAHGEISLTRELNTMMSTSAGRFVLVELLSMDKAYPLYGELRLEPSQSLESATEQRNGSWGIALDPILSERLDVTVGDQVKIGDLGLEVRAIVRNQPDRRLNANWRGAPVLLSDEALDNSGLLHPASRVEYKYRVKTSTDPNAWKAEFFEAFPDSEWEVQTFIDRSQRLGERLAQLASGLLIVAFSTLFIGGLGVFNSISVYLKSKQETMATLRSVGTRHSWITQIYILQVALLASVSSLIGVLFGGFLAWLGVQLIAGELNVALQWIDLFQVASVAMLFGLLTAFTFSLPALGNALGHDVASVFRDNLNKGLGLNKFWVIATIAATSLLLASVLLLIPDTIFGIAFLLVVLLCLTLFEGIVRFLKLLAANMEGLPWLRAKAPIRFALSNLHRPGTPLRMTLLSLGAALTLLVACSTVVGALINMVYTTLPEESPSLILYDVFVDQKAEVEDKVRAYSSVTDLSLAPIVRSRISRINGTQVRDLEFSDSDQQEMARDEHKLSYLAGNIDGIRIVEGELWSAEKLEVLVKQNDVDFLLAMEDREAQQMDLKAGDKVSFVLAGGEKVGLLTAIYSQRGIQTRFWFEAILSDGALERDISRYVGTVYMSENEAQELQRDLAGDLPNVVTILTKEIVASASDLLSKATNGLAALSGVSIFVSLMVLASVMSAGRNRQIYDATIFHAFGARLSYTRSAIKIEYAILGLIVVVFSTLLGWSIAAAILELRLKMVEVETYWVGLLVACLSVFVIFSVGALFLFRQLTIAPSSLLRENA